jgi:hypothetical protein
MDCKLFAHESYSLTAPQQLKWSLLMLSVSPNFGSPSDGHGLAAMSLYHEATSTCFMIQSQIFLEVSALASKGTLSPAAN